MRELAAQVSLREQGLTEALRIGGSAVWRGTGSVKLVSRLFDRPGWRVTLFYPETNPDSDVPVGTLIPQGHSEYDTLAELVSEHPEEWEPYRRKNPAQKYRHKTYRWDAVELFRNLTIEQLHELDEDLRSDPNNRNPAHLAGKSIHIYTKSAERKFDALAWAVTYHLQAKRRGRENPGEAPLLAYEFDGKGWSWSGELVRKNPDEADRLAQWIQDARSQLLYTVTKRKGLKKKGLSGREWAAVRDATAFRLVYRHVLIIAAPREIVGPKGVRIASLLVTERNRHSGGTMDIFVTPDDMTFGQQIQQINAVGRG